MIFIRVYKKLYEKDDPNYGIIYRVLNLCYVLSDFGVKKVGEDNVQHQDTEGCMEILHGHGQQILI